MKSLILSISLVLLSANVWSSEKSEIDLCTEVIVCGEFEGTATWYDTKGNAPIGRDGQAIEPHHEKWIIKKVADNRINVKLFFRASEKAWGNFDLVFKPTGQFDVVNMKYPGEPIIGAGFCRHLVCNIAITPVPVESDKGNYINSYINTFRFEGNQMVRFNMVSNNSNGEELKFQRSILTKK